MPDKMCLSDIICAALFGAAVLIPLADPAVATVYLVIGYFLAMVSCYLRPIGTHRRSKTDAG